MPEAVAHDCQKPRRGLGVPNGYFRGPTKSVQRFFVGSGLRIKQSLTPRPKALSQGRTPYPQLPRDAGLSLRRSTRFGAEVTTGATNEHLTDERVREEAARKVERSRLEWPYAKTA